MKRNSLALGVGLSAFALAPFVATPVLTIDVASASGADVVITRWTEGVDGASRTEIEPRRAPFSIRLARSDVTAVFVVESENNDVRVKATQMRAWLPMIRVSGTGSAVTVSAKPGFLGLRAS